MSSDSWSRERKLQLFERLFQGRRDVFPKRWENAKGRSGWAPCCANEWKPEVCEKPQSAKPARNSPSNPRSSDESRMTLSDLTQCIE